MDELEGGTTVEGTEATDPSEAGTPEVTEDGTPSQGATEAQPQQPESFINPADLPPELKPHWKRMHGAYTKKMQEFSKARQAAETVDRFNNDGDFAKQTVSQWAAQNGYALVQAGQPAGVTGPAVSSQQQVSPQLVEQVKATLPPELQWMAPSLAAAQTAMLQAHLQPILQKQQQEDQTRLNAEYEEMAAQLGETVPGWEEHEEKMLEIYNFLQSPKLSHRQYGSKLKILHALATGNAAAITEASKRMAKAVKRPTSGAAGTPTTSNLTERIRKADKNTAWDLAVAEAKRQTGFTE